MGFYLHTKIQLVLITKLFQCLQPCIMWPLHANLHVQLSSPPVCHTGSLHLWVSIAHFLLFLLIVDRHAAELLRVLFYYFHLETQGTYFWWKLLSICDMSAATFGFSNFIPSEHCRNTKQNTNFNAAIYFWRMLRIKSIFIHYLTINRFSKKLIVYVVCGSKFLTLRYFIATTKIQTICRSKVIKSPNTL